MSSPLAGLVLIHFFFWYGLVTFGIEVIRFIYRNFPKDEVLNNEEFFKWIKSINKR